MDEDPLDEYNGRKIHNGDVTVTRVRQSEPDGYGGFLLDIWGTHADGKSYSNFNVPTKHFESWLGW